MEIEWTEIRMSSSGLMMEVFFERMKPYNYSLHLGTIYVWGENRASKIADSAQDLPHISSFQLPQDSPGWIKTYFSLDLLLAISLKLTCFFLFQQPHQSWRCSWNSSARGTEVRSQSQVTKTLEFFFTKFCNSFKSLSCTVLGYFCEQFVDLYGMAGTLSGLEKDNCTCGAAQN